MKPRIFVVDYNEVYVKMTRTLLEHWDFVVESATTGNEAIEKLKKNDYDLIMLEYRMPDTNGLHLTSKIRQELENYTPIILTTSSPIRDIYKELARVGVTDFATKPFNHDELHKKITQHLVTTP